MGARESVGRRWERIASSAVSSYGRATVSEKQIRSLVGSAYIRPILERTSEGALCIETGCGSGSLSLALASTGRRVVALDIAKGLLQNVEANKLRLAAEVPSVRRITPLRADLEELPFDDCVFDAAFSEGVVEHWVEEEQRLAVLREMARVIRPGGCLVVFVPNGVHPLHGWWKLAGYPGYKYDHELPWHRFSSAELATELEKIGLVDVKHDGISPWSTLGVWPNWMPMRGVAGLCGRLLPEPQWLRRRYGFNLMAAGRKAAKS